MTDFRAQGTGHRVRSFVMASFALLSFAIAGCGYTTRSMVSSAYKTIYIPPLANKIDITTEADTGNKYRIYRPRLETEVTRAISNKYLFDGNLKPVSQERADLTLNGEVVELRRDVLRYDNNDEVEEYRVNVRVNLALYKKGPDELPLWQESGFTGESTYFTPGHPNAKSEEQAITAAVADLARRVVERTVEEW
jgi:hypothetical protein